MKLRLLVSYLLIIVAASFIAIWPHRDQGTADIVDISWPNCNDDLVGLSADQGVVGGLGGLNFHKNPCLHREDRFKNTQVYLNTGYAGTERAKHYAKAPNVCSLSDERCLAYNYGYAAADYSVNQLYGSAVMPSRVWLDVEFGNTWSDDASINRIVMLGMHDRLERYLPGRVGVYSYPGQWKIITGDWRNGWPAWVATGSHDRLAAIRACGQSFTGGPALLAQYTPSKYDLNYICNQASLKRP